MDLPEDFFLTPSFDEKNPINSIRGLDFVSGFKTRKKEKYQYLAGFPDEFKKMMLVSIKKIYNHLSEECSVLRLLEAYEKVSEEALKNYFWRPIIRPYGSIGKTDDPQKTLIHFREIAWPYFIQKYDYTNLARLLCWSVPPRKGQELTRDIMNGTEKRDTIKIYRLVSRAESDLVPYLEELLQKHVNVEIYNAESSVLEKTTRNELRFISPSKDTGRHLHELKRLLKEEYMKYCKKQLKALGTPSDPIYCIRVEEDLSLNTDPHYLGNLITRYNNLCGFIELFRDRGINLEKEERLKIYEYKHDASFRGTVVYDQKEELLRDGIFVVMPREAPGRLCVLHRITTESTKIDVQEAIEASERERHLYKKNDEVVEALRETRDNIADVAETINGKASDTDKEKKLHEELESKIIEPRISERIRVPDNLDDLKRRLHSLYERFPSLEVV